MITKQTAYDIWITYDEIAKGEKLLADLEEQRLRGEELNLRDAFGRRRNLQLGVPNGEKSQRLLDVHPALAVSVIKSHIATKKAELETVMVRAGAELTGDPSSLPPTT